jgi:hypothetical protein
MSQMPTDDPEPKEGEQLAPPGAASDQHRRAVERLLWTPTEGQDLTKSYFPLSDNSDDSD